MRTLRDAAPLSSEPLFAWAEADSARTADGDRFARFCGVADYDACERRHGGSAASEAANLLAAPTKEQQRAAVLAAVVRAGAEGITCRELAARWGVEMHTISGRFSELRDLGEIRVALDADGGEIRRDKCGVWIWTGLDTRSTTWR